MNYGTTVEPSDENYPTLHGIWVARNRPSTIEKLSEGWQYRAIFPSGGASPTFTLIVTGELTDADRDGPPGGVSYAMSVSQSSLPGGQRTLPKE